jgi:sugar phosphate isomerase/epimerase
MTNKPQRFPFKIGTTSYIIEAGILENLRWLASRVGEVQLVLFETSGYSNIPSKSDVAYFAKAAEDGELALTVHLPGDIELGSLDRSTTERSSERFRRIVGLTAPLCPICWVFHVSLPPEGESTGVYIERMKERLAPLMGEFDSPRELAIENIHPAFEVEPPLIMEFDTSVCIDIGHILSFGMDVWGHLGRWLPRCRNIHLHGLRNGRDHSSLACLPDGFVHELFQRISTTPALKTVTIEVFGRDDFESSISVLDALPPICPQA